MEESDYQLAKVKQVVEIIQRAVKEYNPEEPQHTPEYPVQGRGSRIRYYRLALHGSSSYTVQEGGINGNTYNPEGFIAAAYAADWEVLRDDGERALTMGNREWIRDCWSLFVSNLSSNVKARDLYCHFREAGIVFGVFVPRNKQNGVSSGFAFIRYKT